MTLRITDNGPIINQELADYIEQRFAGIYFNEIYISMQNDDDELKTVNIQYPNIGLTLPNTICMVEEDLNQNIIDWLNTL